MAADGWCYVWSEGYRAPQSKVPVGDPVVDVRQPRKHVNQIRPRTVVQEALVPSSRKGATHKRKDGRYSCSAALLGEITTIIYEHQPIRPREVHQRLARKGVFCAFGHMRSAMHDLVRAGVLSSKRLVPNPPGMCGIVVVYEMVRRAA